MARTVDRNIAHMEETLKRASAHKGAAFVEILQNCNVYNDMAWKVLYDKESKVMAELRLEHGKPLLFGPADDRRALVLEGVRPKVVRAADVPADRVWVHDETDTATALVLAQLFAPDYPIPLGVLAASEETDLRADPDPPGAGGHLRAWTRRHREASALGRDLADQVGSAGGSGPLPNPPRRAATRGDSRGLARSIDTAAVMHGSGT